jgi:hypothetical protein
MLETIGFLFLLFSLLSCLIVILQVGTIFFTFPPSITSANKVINYLIKETAEDNSWGLRQFYDMGSGNGSLAYLLAKNNKNLSVYGYEKFHPSYLWAKIFRRRSNLSFCNQDFLSIKASEPAFFYFFLTPKYFNNLFPIIKNIIPRGSCIITYNIDINSMRPTKIISYNDFFQQRKIYFYIY